MHSEYAKTHNADSGRFLAEPNVLARLSDLNVVPQLYSVTFDNPGVGAVLWYEMEWLGEYVTLRKYVGAKGTKIALGFFHKIFPKLIHHINAMHVRGIVHRDLTPENIMVTPNLDNLRIVDFGLVRFTSGLVGDELTAFSEIDGIKEQWIDGLSCATEAADWYAIGSIAWALLMGSTPYRQPEDVRSAPMPMQSLLDNLTYNTGLSQTLAACIAGLISPNPKMRLEAARNALSCL